MTTYQIQGPTKQCALTGRTLKAGEKFYSVLTDQAGQLVRTDYSVEAWKGPPAGAIAFWSGRIPSSNRPPRPTINEGLLVDCFAHLADSTDVSRQHFRYVLALLLMRKKRFRFEDVRREGRQEFLCLRDVQTGQRHELLDPRLTEAEMQSVQEEIFRVLGWE